MLNANNILNLIEEILPSDLKKEGEILTEKPGPVTPGEKTYVKKDKRTGKTTEITVKKGPGGKDQIV